MNSNAKMILKMLFWMSVALGFVLIVITRSHNLYAETVTYEEIPAGDCTFESPTCYNNFGYEFKEDLYFEEVYFEADLNNNFMYSDYYSCGEPVIDENGYYTIDEFYLVSIPSTYAEEYPRCSIVFINGVASMVYDFNNPQIDTPGVGYYADDWKADPLWEQS